MNDNKDDFESVSDDPTIVGKPAMEIQNEVRRAIDEKKEDTVPEKNAEAVPEQEEESPAESSEDDFDEPFTVHRALRRNRVIHALGQITFVAQCTLGRGGTWDGSTQNLRRNWSLLYCFSDGSAACAELEQMGARLIGVDELLNFKALSDIQTDLFSLGRI